MISFLIEWISWIIYLNKNYTYIHTYLYIKLYIHTYLYIIWKRKFLLFVDYFLLHHMTISIYVTYTFKNTEQLSFFNRHIFGVYAFFHSMGTFLINGHIFIQNAHFSFNRHISSQQAPFDISNMKGYNISICTFWYI